MSAARMLDRVAGGLVAPSVCVMASAAAIHVIMRQFMVLTWVGT